MRTQKEIERVYRAIMAHRKTCPSRAAGNGMCAACHEYTLGTLDWVLGRFHDKFNDVLYPVK